MKNPEITVVLGSFNRLPFLKLTIASIREELKPFDKHEIIVVDGGSDDGSLEWLLVQKDVITIVQHNRGTWNNKKIERRSWGYFMNLAFKAAQGTYVCMLSDDCLLVPGALINGYQHAQQQRQADKNIGAVAFYFRDWSKDDAYHVGITLGDKMYVNHGLYLNQALKDVDYIDEHNYFFYSGDGDLCLKMWHKGYEVIDSPNSYVEHYPHANIKVRKTNSSQFKRDSKNYIAKWEGIFYNPKFNNLGKNVFKTFEDTTQTGNQFETMHREVLEKHPHVIKESLFTKFDNQLRWKYRAAIRKFRNLTGL